VPQLEQNVWGWLAMAFFHLHHVDRTRYVIDFSTMNCAIPSFDESN
jgi:hypothetical protein